MKAKTSKMLDKAEDPRETLDYSYEKQLEMVQKVRRGLADVATSRKRLELQGTQLKASADKLESQARQAVGAGREDLAQEALTRRAGIQRPARRPRRPTGSAPGGGGQADAGPPAAPDQGRGFPHQEGDDQGHLHSRRGHGQDRGGRFRHLRGDGRRRPGHPAGGRQDRHHAGQGRGGRRADRLGALDDVTRAGRRHPAPARRPVGRLRGRRRTGQDEGRARAPERPAPKEIASGGDAK